ncbi:hypothetical protein SUNI508_02362 [Seiridium unicorne]|uniref:Uncharacterized protein n=1 Tax=Seiridium unicorne TaxID=138068 RepID=A0ABR2UHZ3_9PEZI
MELTPIRIPGKRRRKGEPPIVFDTIPRKEKGKGKSKRTKRQKVVKPRASYLERQLPLEIMERIFWMSENVNFAKSGPRVGHLLSGESTRRATFMQAFGHTWDVWFGCHSDNDTGIRSYHGWQEDPARFGGNPDFQSALLRYSWVDVSFILDCMDAWVKRSARNRFFQHQKLWGDSNSLRKLDDDPGGFGNFRSARQYFEHDYDAFCSKVHHDLPALNGQPSLIEIHPDTQIPDNLLTGPWDEGATQKLFWLVRAGARLSADQTWETTLEGYHKAIAGNSEFRDGDINLPVIRLILILGGNHWPQYVADSELAKLQDKEETLRDRGQRDVYHKYACVATMLLQRYSASDSGM